MKKLNKHLKQTTLRAMALGILLLFFTPWVVVDVDLVKPVGVITQAADKAAGTNLFSKMVSGVTDTAGSVIGVHGKATLSGFDIANSGRSRIAEQLSGLLSLVGQEAKDPRKIRLLFLVPLLAILVAWLLTGPLAKQKLVRMLTAYFCVLLAVFVGYKLITVSVDNQFAQVELAYGVWFTFLLFFVIGALEIYEIHR